MRLVAVSAALALGTLSAQSNPLGAAAVAKDIEQQLSTAHVPGAAIAVALGDEVYAGNYGIADLASGAAMTPLTLMQVGSVTKVFTALAVVSALEARALPPDTSVGQVKPGLAARAATTTFHHLLSQTSGLRDRPGDSGDGDELALASSARELTSADFLLPAGVVFSYSNLGYALAGAALESMSKKGFAEALRESALTPLGMERSTVRPSEVASRPRGVGYRLQGTTATPVGPAANDTRIWPAGYLWSNATDMSRALSALINRGRVTGHPGLPPTVVDRVTTPHVAMPNVFVGGHYGYGLMIARERDVLMYEHGGTLPGFSAIIRIAPERRLGIAILTNLDNAPLRRIAQSVMARALGLPEASPAARPETAVTVDEMTSFVGRYENRGSAELAVRDNAVVLMIDDGPPLPIARIGDNRFIARAEPGAPGPEFVLQPATDKAPAYLHFALWAYVRR
jgi:CubicO group peptidase (beta-lactamase class C family)